MTPVAASAQESFDVPKENKVLFTTEVEGEINPVEEELQKRLKKWKRRKKRLLRNTNEKLRERRRRRRKS